MSSREIISFYNNGKFYFIAFIRVIYIMEIRGADKSYMNMNVKSILTVTRCSIEEHFFNQLYVEVRIFIAMP